MSKPTKRATRAKALSAEMLGAIVNGELDTVKDLVQRGVPLQKALGSSNFPPLHYAIQDGKTAIAKYLIQSGADVNFQATDQQQTPLMMAANEGKLEILQALLTVGADIHTTDESGWTALDLAASCEGSSAGAMVEALIKAGASVDRFSKTWGPPLIKACWRGHPSACGALAAHGADVNAMTPNGTPLMQAIDNKRAELISILLAAGAEPNLRYSWPETLGGNKEFLGKTPLELAQERKLKKILAFLETSQKKQSPAPRREPMAADIPVLWKSLEKVLAKVAPTCRQSLAKPATAKELSKTATMLNTELAEDFNTSYLIHNGQKQDAGGLYFSGDSLDEPYSLLPLNQIVNEWKKWKALLDQGDLRGQECAPDNGIRTDWWHPGWIPFMSNGGGDSLCVDHAPSEKGIVGQIIQMNHDSARQSLIARSFAAFLKLLIEQWDNQAEE